MEQFQILPHDLPEADRTGEEKRKLAFKIREAILDAILEAWSGPYSKEDLLLLAKEFYDPIWNDSQKKILVRKGLKPKKEQYTQNTRAPMHEWLAKQTAEELHVFLLEIALFRLLEGHGRDGKRDPLIETAKRYGVDPRKIEAKFRAEVKTKKAEKKGKGKKSPSVKEKVAKRNPVNPALVKSGTCRLCGCTEEKFCPGGCAWTDKTKTICTACQMAKEHLWEKQNLITVASTKKVPMHDIYKCKKCGATAKRFGIGSIRRDEKFAKLEECPGPKKDLQTSAKKKK